MVTKIRCVAAIISLLFVLTACSVNGQSTWETYHKDTHRQGLNILESQDASSMGLIWSFPRTDVSPILSSFAIDMFPDEFDTTVDSALTGNWGTTNTLPGSATNYYGSNSDDAPGFYWAEAASSASATAIWKFPVDAESGRYLIEAWFPSTPSAIIYGSSPAFVNTKSARYTLKNSSGAAVTSFTVDQTDGGRWVTLGTADIDADYYVELSNKTDDDFQEAIDGGFEYIVNADAIKYKSPGSGIEIYSSPTADVAKIDSADVTRDVPAVWIGAIENANASLAHGVTDFGAMYCVRSYQGLNIGSDPSDDDYWTNPEVVGVGTAAWRYPRGGAYDEATRLPRNRASVEGPIGSTGETGGVFSSATIVSLADGTKAVVFGGMDGQVYCLNATTGELVWKGPGTTISEAAPAGWTMESGGANGRYDAFGGSFSYTNATTSDTNASSVIYAVPVDSDPGQDSLHSFDAQGKYLGTGRMYAVYAWIPGWESGDIPRSQDAAYGITHYDPESEGKTVTTWVRVDQSNDGDAATVGRWVKIGTNYWNPTEIELSNHTVAGDSSRVVVADAIMVVPAEIGAFSYSTPVWDGANKVYLGNANGRIYSFELNPTTGYQNNKSTRLTWTYPRVQTVNPTTSVEDGAAGALGAFVASPAIAKDGSNDILVAPSMDGNVYALKNINSNAPEVDWTYYSSHDNDDVPTLINEPFSSSAAVYSNGKIYVASTGGRLHAIYAANKGNDGQRAWVVPDSLTGEVPLPSFKFSTPAVYEDGANNTRIYVASSGGTVYAFQDEGTTGSRILYPTFYQPDYYSPIQGSIAIDSQTFFIGTMGSDDEDDDGSIWWAARDSGRPDYGSGEWLYAGWSNLGRTFSSPAVANNYIYVGTANGRLYAFSSADGGAFAGNWVGGHRHSRPPGSRAEPPSPSTNSQIDMFKSAVYQASLDAFKAQATADAITTPDISTISAAAAANSFVDASVTHDEKPVDWHKRAFPYESGFADTFTSPRSIYVEWGETLYLIAWNLPRLATIAGAGGTTETAGAGTWVGSSAKRRSVRANFTNASMGAGSGGTIQAQAAEALYEYTYLDSDGTLRRACVAFIKVEISPDRPTPPSPGAAWTVSLSIRIYDSGGNQGSAPPSVVPVLEGSPGNWTVQWEDATAKDKWQQQPVGVNNPLAIRDEGLHPGAAGPMAPIGLAWPTQINSDGTFKPNRNDPAAHFNGNGTYDSEDSNVWTEVIPQLYLGNAMHGANSYIAKLGIMDRSAVGLRGTPVMEDGNLVDYDRTGSIKSFRIQTSDLHWHGGNSAAYNMMPWDWPPYDAFDPNIRLQRDYPDIARRQEFFQKSPDNNDPSFDRSMLQPSAPDRNDRLSMDYDKSRLRPDYVESWVQVPRFQPANTSRPGYGTTAYAYLDTNNNARFDSGDVVDRRPTTYVEVYRKFQMSLDVPPDYHMVVEQPLTIDIVGPDRAIAPHGLGIGLPPIALEDWYKTFTVRNLGNVNLSNIKVAKRISSGAGAWDLDLPSDHVSPLLPLSGTNILSSFDGWDPYWGDTTSDPFTNAGGYTLSKARTTDVTGSVLTLPDTRRYQENPGILPDGVLPKLPGVSIMVPLTQATGSYSQLVPVFSDMNNNGVLDLGQEPFTDPTFRLNVAVGEDRLTGGATPGSADQIEGSTPVTYGNTQPAAWRDPTTGDVHLFWSTNRFDASGNLRNTTGTAAANVPWYLAHANLKYDLSKGGVYDFTGQGVQWWEIPTSPQLPGFMWPSDSTLTDPIAESVKHSSPFAAVNPDANDVWLFWQGHTDASDDDTGKIIRENRIFYTSATGGVVTGSEQSVFSFDRDVNVIKMSPKATVYNAGNNENIWLTWHGGDYGRWNIFGNLNSSPKDSHDSTVWSPDIRFTTPSSLVSVSDPMPMQRTMAGYSNYLDLVYTGASKYDQSTDIIMTRYQWSGGATNPRVNPVPLPRVFDEELLRDNKLNIYTSENLSWMIPSSSGSSANEPEIRVAIPENSGALTLTATNGTNQLDRATGVYTYSYTVGSPEDTHLGEMLVDYSAGIIRFTKALPVKTKVFADYTPRARRLTRGLELDSAPYVFIEKTPMSNSGVNAPNPGLALPATDYSGPRPVDRMWLFWTKPTSGVQASAIYYKTYRLTVDLDRLGMPAVGLDKNTGKPVEEIELTGTDGPAEVSWDGKKLFFTAADERYRSMSGYPGAITVKYTPVGQTSPVTATIDDLAWEEEIHETALPTRQRVNEGQVCAFADPRVSPTKIWVFWSSSRAGQSDLYFQTLSPNFRALY